MYELGSDVKQYTQQILRSQNTKAYIETGNTIDYDIKSYQVKNTRVKSTEVQLKGL